MLGANVGAPTGAAVAPVRDVSRPPAMTLGLNESSKEPPKVDREREEPRARPPP